MYFKRHLFLFGLITVLLTGATVVVGWAAAAHQRSISASEYEAGFDANETEAEFSESSAARELSAEEQYRRALTFWRRPDGPPRVALQAGHWQASEAPDELENLRANGTSGGGKKEWEVNLEIARKAAALIEAAGVAVEILPTTVPPAYYADAFVAIHADGNPNAAVAGYKVAAPRRDLTGQAARLAALVEESYGRATDLELDPNVTRNMRGYYAFNWRRYEHSLHPMTPAMILETGFLTNARDRRIIVSGQERAAEGLAEAVIVFLQEQGLLAR